MTCFFLGHRDAPADIYPALLAAVKRHVDLGVTTFYVGQYGSFDRMAATAVLELKRTSTSIELYLLLPYHPAERTVKTPDGFDGTYYPDGIESVPRRLAITRANRLMIEACDNLIAYAVAPGSTRDTVRWAESRTVVTNLGWG